MARVGVAWRASLEEEEADEVRVEHGTQQLVAHGDGAEDVGGGEGRVQEEADLRRAVPAKDIRGEQQQVVVVHPHHVARLVDLHDLLGELLVGGAVGTPLVVAEGVGVVGHAQEVVEDRAEVAAAEAMVEVGLHLLGLGVGVAMVEVGLRLLLEEWPSEAQGQG
eukprot:scaffold116230_cov39-Phaeocystis_antarctica.AAC.1